MATRPERLAGLVREWILSGAVPAGGPVRQDALAAVLGVSKIPLREAMARLEQEGLLRSEANRGYFVRPLTAGEANEVYALRLKLEPETAALACLAAGEEERELARASLERLEEAAERRPGDLGARNRDFHLALIRPARRPVTLAILERLHFLAERYVRKHLEPQGRDVRAREEHRALLGAWLEREPGLVGALMTAHLDATMADLEGQLAPVNEGEK